MTVADFSGQRRHSLLYHTEGAGLHKVPAIASLAPLVMLCNCLVNHERNVSAE